MTGTKTGLANRARRRAYTTAWFALALAALPLVPVPAAIIALTHKGLGIDHRLLPTLGHFVVAATPAFALPAFAFGCFVGAAIHMQINSAERIGVIEAGLHRSMGARPVLASGLIVGCIFAATGLVLAAVWPGML